MEEKGLAGYLRRRSIGKGTTSANTGQQKQEAKISSPASVTGGGSGGAGSLSGLLASAASTASLERALFSRGNSSWNGSSMSTNGNGNANNHESSSGGNNNTNIIGRGNSGSNNEAAYNLRLLMELHRQQQEQLQQQVLLQQQQAIMPSLQALLTQQRQQQQHQQLQQHHTFQGSAPAATTTANNIFSSLNNYMMNNSSSDIETLLRRRETMLASQLLARQQQLQQHANLDALLASASVSRAQTLQQHQAPAAASPSAAASSNTPLSALFAASSTPLQSPFLSSSTSNNTDVFLQRTLLQASQNPSNPLALSSSREASDFGSAAAAPVPSPRMFPERRERFNDRSRDRDTVDEAVAADMDHNRPEEAKPASAKSGDSDSEPEDGGGGDDDDDDGGSAENGNADEEDHPANDTFPFKLHRMLEHAEKNGLGDVISFRPEGKSFAIHKPREFVSSIMPKYFTTSRMSSFQRQLNLYGFRRITEGHNKGSYFHKFFVQGKRGLCKKIKRKKTSSKTPGVFDAQPQNTMSIRQLLADRQYGNQYGGGFGTASTTAVLGLSMAMAAGHSTGGGGGGGVTAPPPIDPSQAVVNAQLSERLELLIRQKQEEDRLQLQEQQRQQQQQFQSPNGGFP